MMNHLWHRNSNMCATDLVHAFAAFIMVPETIDAATEITDPVTTSWSGVARIFFQRTRPAGAFGYPAGRCMEIFSE